MNERCPCRGCTAAGKEGYDAGYDVGYDAGYDEGRALGYREGYNDHARSVVIGAEMYGTPYVQHYGTEYYQHGQGGNP